MNTTDKYKLIQMLKKDLAEQSKYAGTAAKEKNEDKFNWTRGCIFTLRQMINYLEK